MLRKWFSAVVAAMMVMVGLGACSIPNARDLARLHKFVSELNEVQKGSFQRQVSRYNAKKWANGLGPFDKIAIIDCFNTAEAVVQFPELDKNPDKWTQFDKFRVSNTIGTEIITIARELVQAITDNPYIDLSGADVLSEVVSSNTEKWLAEQANPDDWYCYIDNIKQKGRTEPMPDNLEPENVTDEDIEDHWLSRDADPAAIIAIIGAVEWAELCGILVALGSEGVTSCSSGSYELPPAPVDGGAPDPGSP